MLPKPRVAQLRHTIQVNVAHLLRNVGKLDAHRHDHAPLMRYEYVRTFEEKGISMDRYDCRTRVRRNGHVIDQRTLIDIGADGSIRLAPKV
jgi:hypothetical protein